MALGFRQRMAERGLHVTEDMQVIGYDNILRRFGLGLRMTTVEQSVVDLAAAGWGMLAVESTPWYVAMAIPVRAVRGSPRRR